MMWMMLACLRTQDAPEFSAGSCEFSCAPYACGYGDTCDTECFNEDDCAAGYFCCGYSELDDGLCTESEEDRCLPSPQSGVGLGEP